MLDVYRDFCRELLAMPVIQGVKTANERFAGARRDATASRRMMQDGKALQCGTSHDLGQNFGKAFDVKFQNQSGEREYVWQTSWGVTTRLIGALIMAHSDDEGLVLPPRSRRSTWRSCRSTRRTRSAPPCSRRAQAHRRASCATTGSSVELDDREGLKPGAKYYEWERKGVPLRLEIGPRDLEAGTVMAKRASAAEGAEKEKLPMEGLGVGRRRGARRAARPISSRAPARGCEANTVLVDTWDDFAAAFEGAGSKFVHAHWDGTTETELAIKEATKATIRCLPARGPGPADRARQCIKTGRPSARRVLFAKNY